MQVKFLLKVCATAVITAVAALVAFQPEFLWIARSDYFLFTTLLGVVLIHLRLKSAWWDFLLVSGGTLALCMIAQKMVPFPLTAFAYLSFPGLISGAVMAGRCVWNRSDRRLLVPALGTSIVFVAAGGLTPWVLHYIEVIRPTVLDLYLDSFDSSLGVQPSFLLGRAFLRWHWFGAVSIWFYLGLSLVLALVFVENLRRQVRRALWVVAAFLVCAPAGELFYAIFPALGPRLLFQKDFPLHPLAMADAARLQLQPIVLAGPRNAIPSLHMAWVLLAWWCSEGTPRISRAVAALFIVFTVTSTMGTGEHYFIDLIVAVPFAVVLYAIFCCEIPWRDLRRWLAVSVGLSLVMAWFALLRYAPSIFWISPVVPWSLAIATIGGSLLLKSGLGAVTPDTAQAANAPTEAAIPGSHAARQAG